MTPGMLGLLMKESYNFMDVPLFYSSGVLAGLRQESEGKVNGLTCRIKSGSIYSYQDARR